MKPRTWPEMSMPTDEQWLDWLLSNDREDQIEIARRTNKMIDQGAQCIAMGHDGLMHELDATRCGLARSLQRERRYRLAWKSARRYRQRVQMALSEYLTRSDS